MEKKYLELKDVENFMGISAKDFVSENAKKLHPSFDGFDKLKLAATAASAVQYGVPDHRRRRRDSKEKFFKRLEYKPGPNETLIHMKTERLLQPHEDNKRKFNNDCDYQEEEKINRSKKRTKRTTSARQTPPPPPLPEEIPPLPQEVRRVIRESGPDEKITEPVLVIQKVLENSDIKKDQNRLSIPANQVKSSFLWEREEEFLRRRKIDVNNNDKDIGVECMNVGFIQPNLKIREGITLRRWQMNKSNGSTGSVSYMLNGKWRRVVEDEGYKIDDPKPKVVQLWAYRVDGKLCFALVNVPNPNPSY